MARSIVNRHLGYNIIIEPSLSETFGGYEALVFNISDSEYVDTFYFRTLDEAIEFAESEEMEFA